MTTRKTRIATRYDDSVMSGRLVRFSQNMRRVPIAFVLVISAAIGGGCAITPRISFLSEPEAFGFGNDQMNGVAATSRYVDWTLLAAETRRTVALAPIDSWKPAVFVGHLGKCRGRGQHQERNDQGRRTKSDRSAVRKVTYRPVAGCLRADPLRSMKWDTQITGFP